MCSFIVVSQVSCGFSTKNQHWQTCVCVTHVLCVSSQWPPCLRAESSPSTKLRIDYGRKRARRYSRGGKKTAKKARGEEPQGGRGKHSEKTMTGTHGIPGIDRDLRVDRSLLSSKYIEKFCLSSDGWLTAENYCQWYPLRHLLRWEVSARI